MPKSFGGVFLPTYDVDITGAWTFSAAPTLGVTDAFVSAAAVQTLTNKTIAAKAIVTTIAGDGAIVIAPGLVVLTKGSPAAITLAAPAAGDVGTEITIYGGSAFAHVVTATGLIDDGVTGGSKTTATLGAFVGASLTLVAAQVGKWGVKAKNVVTIT